MPKRSSAARNAAQRQRPKAQKNIELVRPATSESETQTEESTPAAATRSATATATTEKTAEKTTATEQVQEKTATEAAKSTSASARLAARRQATQRTQQRNASNLITPEHFAYVRKDLIFIAILAVIMIAAIIILYFTVGATA